MNKTALAIKMLQYLYGSGQKSRAEISEALEVSERQVISLKEELEVAGYDFESKRGLHGGYTLKGGEILPSLKLKEHEKEALNHSIEYLKGKTDFIYLNDFIEVIQKMKYISETEYHQNHIIYLTNLHLDSFAKKEIKNLEKAIENQRRIIIHYIGLKSLNIEQYEIEPYWVLFFDNSYYLVGYEIRKKAFRTFKITKQRMKKIEYHNDYFVRLDYNKDEIVGKMNLIKKPLEEVEFEVYGKNARLIYEQQIGVEIDEKVWLEDRTTLNIKTKVEGVASIKKLMLSLGKDCKVIKPVSLVEEIKEELLQAIQQYD